MSVMQLRRSKLSQRQISELMKLFVAGTTARATAEVVGVNRNTAILFFQRCRKAIAAHQERQWPFYGEVEVDESYFGGRRKKKHSRGAAGKVPVFGILKRGGKVYAQAIENAKAKTIVPIIKQKVTPDSTSTATHSRVTTACTSRATTTYASIIPRRSPRRNATTSMGSRTSGAWLNVTCGSSTVSRKRPSICI